MTRRLRRCVTLCCVALFRDALSCVAMRLGNVPYVAPRRVACDARPCAVRRGNELRSATVDLSGLSALVFRFDLLSLLPDSREFGEAVVTELHCPQFAKSGFDHLLT